MSARTFEAFLTRVYADVGTRARFKANPREEARRAGLTDEECAELEKLIGSVWRWLPRVSPTSARRNGSSGHIFRLHVAYII